MTHTFDRLKTCLGDVKKWLPGNKLKLNLNKTEFISFAYDVPQIWNDLPDDVRSATSLHSSNKKLKTYLFAKTNPPIFFPGLSPWC